MPPRGDVSKNSGKKINLSSEPMNVKEHSSHWSMSFLVNLRHDAIQDPVTPKTSNADSLSPVLTEEHTAVTNDRPQRLRTQTQKYQARFA